MAPGLLRPRQMECLRALGALSPGSYGASCKVSYKDSVKVSKKTILHSLHFKGLELKVCETSGLLVDVRVSEFCGVQGS